MVSHFGKIDLLVSVKKINITCIVNDSVLSLIRVNTTPFSNRNIIFLSFKKVKCKILQIGELK